MLINPYQDSVGLNMPKLKVNVVATTDLNNDQTNNLDRLQGDPMKITGPGEYEVQGIFFYGIPNTGGRTMFVIEAEGIKVGHPGVTVKELSYKELELFEGVDVLLLPLTGEDSKACSQIISQVEPRVIIPIQFKTPKVKEQLDTIDAFAKEMGVKDIGGEKKVILKKKDLPVEETQIQVLSPI